MKIALCTIGSRGDIQPFLVLGEYLAQRGHQVRVCSAQMYAGLAEHYAVEYVAFAGNYAAIADDEALKKQIGRNPFTIGKGLKEKVYPILENSLETFYDQLLWADVVLYHPKTMIDGIGSNSSHKLIKAYMVPLFSPTRAFANPILAFLPIPRFLNRITYKLANALLGAFNRPLKNFKKKRGLPVSKPLLDTPILYGISPSFLPRPQDYPANHYYTGFWTPPHQIAPLPKRVQAFMKTAQPKLVITFGSMPYRSEVDINDFVAAIQRKYEVDILIVRGWGLKNTAITESDTVMAIDHAPFSSLFPLATAVVHHGGAGTTAIALEAGLPQMICPVLHPFGDQYFWGQQLSNNGLGPHPVPLAKLSVASLLDGIATLLQEETQQKAAQLQLALATENGLETASQLIEAHYKHHRNRMV